MHRVGFLTAEQIRSTKSVGSTMIRARWLINHWPEAELYKLGHRYATIIFQKAYWTEYAERFGGVKIVDICDPDFLNWNSNCMKMIDLCDAVTTCSNTLADTLRNYTDRPVVCIPDRLDFNQFPHAVKTHAGNGRARTAAWYGYSINYPSLDRAYEELNSCGIERLIVVSDRNKPYVRPVGENSSVNIVNYEWSESTVYSYLCEADIVLNFTMPHGRWLYKSNNKSLVAWALGLPVAHSRDELALLLDEEARIQAVSAAQQAIRAEYDVRLSVQQYKDLIERVRGDVRDYKI